MTPAITPSIAIETFSAAGGASTAGVAGGALDNDGGEPAGGSAPASGGSAQGGEAGSSGSVLFSDDFEDGDASGWSAASWRVFADGDNQVMRQNAAYSGTTTSAIAGDEGWGDRRMEVSFKFEQAGVSYAIFGTEFESADNRDQIMIDRAGSGTLLHASGGQTTTVDTHLITQNALTPQQSRDMVLNGQLWRDGDQ